MKTKIIIEIGCNHQGRIDYAKQMIDDAESLGLWGVKFQKRDIGSIPEKIRLKPRDIKSSFGKTYGEHRRALEFNCKQILELKEYTENKGLKFCISVFDLTSLKQMLHLKMEYIKLPSQLYESSLVKYLYNGKLKYNVNIMLSTGMHTLEQIFKHENREYADIMFYCRSIYPCQIKEVNFKAFLDFKNKLHNKKIGYSSHDLNGEAIQLMVFMGAEYIERHYTLDKNMKGSDHKTVSSDYEDMQNIIERIDMIEEIKEPYDLHTSLLEKEKETRSKFLEGFYMDEKWYKKTKDNNDYKAYVGPRHMYDIMGDLQTKLLLNIGLKNNDSVLDVGCGSLRAGIQLIPIAKSYTGVEPDTWALREGYKKCIEVHGLRTMKNKKPQFRKSIDRVKGKFDYIMLHSIFSHAPLEMIKTYLEKLKDLLAPKGKIVITYVPGKVNYKGSEFIYPGLVTYRTDFIFDLFEKYGYKLSQAEWPHTTQKWVILEKWVMIEKGKECLKKG